MEAEFEEPVIDVTAVCKGRFSIGSFLWPVIRALLNGHIRRLIRYVQGKTEELLDSETMKTFLGYDVDIQKANGEYNLHVQADSSMIDLLMRGNEND